MVKIMRQCTIATRESTRRTTMISTKHWNDMARVVAYLKDKPFRGHRLRKTTYLKSISLADSDFDAEKSSEKIVSLYLCTVGRILTH